MNVKPANAALRFDEVPEEGINVELLKAVRIVLNFYKHSHGRQLRICNLSPANRPNEL